MQLTIITNLLVINIILECVAIFNVFILNVTEKINTVESRRFMRKFLFSGKLRIIRLKSMS